MTAAPNAVERPVYRKLPAILKGRSDLAVRLQVGAIVDWVPRTCLCGLTDREIDRRAIGDGLTVRVMVWKADEIGWTAEPPLPILPLGPRA
jgi:hypothetical protein